MQDGFPDITVPGPLKTPGLPFVKRTGRRPVLRVTVMHDNNAFLIHIPERIFNIPQCKLIYMHAIDQCKLCLSFFKYAWGVLLKKIIACFPEISIKEVVWVQERFPDLSRIVKKKCRVNGYFKIAFDPK